MNNHQKIWEERKVSLKNLGYKTYSEYLNSKIWKDVRKKVLNGRKDRAFCYICGERNGIEIHHLHYRCLDKPILGSGFVLCREHHQEMHDVAKSEGCGLKEAAKLVCLKWMRSGRSLHAPWMDRRYRKFLSQ